MSDQKQIKDGGPAFPEHCHTAFGPQGNVVQFQHDYGFNLSSGMTIRDYFAAAALQGLLAQSCGTAYSSDMKLGAEYCYKMSDAMLAAREKGTT